MTMNMKSDADLVAEFLANKGAKKIAEGARAYDEKQMFRAIRGEPVNSDAAENRAHELQDAAMEARLNGHSVTGYDSRGNVYIGNGRRY